MSKSFSSKIHTTWNCALHKIYSTVDNVLMYTGCLLIKEELLFRGLKFLKQFSAVNNTVVPYDFSTFDRIDLTNEIGLNLRLYLSDMLSLFFFLFNV